MVQKVVVLFTCDICKTTATEEHIEKLNPEQEPLPKTWTTLDAYTNGKQILALQLCPDCMKAIQDALLESDEIVKRRKGTDK